LLKHPTLISFTRSLMEWPRLRDLRGRPGEDIATPMDRPALDRETSSEGQTPDGPAARRQMRHRRASGVDYRAARGLDRRLFSEARTNGSTPTTIWIGRPSARKSAGLRHRRSCRDIGPSSIIAGQSFLEDLALARGTAPSAPHQIPRRAICSFSTTSARTLDAGARTICSKF